MKVLLKHPQTGKFLQAADRWTTNATLALDFKTTPAAMDFSRVHAHNGDVIVLKFADARDDMELKNCC